GVIYKRRGAFEEALGQINSFVGGMVDQAEDGAQRMFPHYFEKYKTDGVEFTLYLGQSLLKNKTFDEFYIRNFRLWQLILMCSIEQQMVRIKPSLKSRLDITQLILVDRKSTRLNSSHVKISYAVFCLKKKKKETTT